MNTEVSRVNGRSGVRSLARLGASMACGLALAMAAGQAHDTWLQPERFAATPGATLMLDLQSADGFVGIGTALQAERVGRTWGRLGPVDLKVGDAVMGDRSLRFPVTLTRPGVAVVGVELKPRLLELESEQIETYFREIHAGDDLRDAWTAMPEPRRWREKVGNYAKTFVRVGAPSPEDRAWAEPLGLALEIVPERDPTALKAGDALAVRVVRGGKPFAGFVLAYVSFGETREHVTVTDVDGRATATLDVKGTWLVQGTDLRRVTGSNDREWESDFTTMVVEVL